VVVDSVGRGRCSLGAIHADAQLVLDGEAAGGVVAGRGPASQDGRHSGYARVLGLALGIVHAQRLEGRQARGLLAWDHCAGRLLRSALRRRETKR
jgi:hypothetical protein